MKTIKSESKKTTVTNPAVVKTPIKAPVTPATVSTPAPIAAHGTAVAPAPVRTATVKTPAAKKGPAAPISTSRREITGECIAARAYSLWEQQGRPHGRDFEIWLQAENQLKQDSQSLAA